MVSVLRTAPAIKNTHAWCFGRVIFRKTCLSTAQLRQSYAIRHYLGDYCGVVEDECVECPLFSPAGDAIFNTTTCAYKHWASSQRSRRTRTGTSCTKTRGIRWFAREVAVDGDSNYPSTCVRNFGTISEILDMSGIMWTFRCYLFVFFGVLCS